MTLTGTRQARSIFGREIEFLYQKRYHRLYLIAAISAGLLHCAAALLASQTGCQIADGHVRMASHRFACVVHKTNALIQNALAAVENGACNIAGCRQEVVERSVDTAKDSLAVFTSC